jgi:hypothetical protein
MKSFYYQNLYKEVYNIMERVESANSIQEGIEKEIPNALFKVKNAAKDFPRRPMHIALALLIIKYGEVQIWLNNNKGFKCQFSEKNNYKITNFMHAYYAMHGHQVSVKHCSYI